MNSAANYGCELLTLVAHAGTVKRIRKQDVRIGDRLFVFTENSLYTVRVAADGWYDVSGGWFDSKGVAPLRTRIAGCTWGGSALMVDAVAALGLCLEFGNRVTTSPIQKIIVIPRERQN